MNARQVIQIRSDNKPGHAQSSGQQPAAARDARSTFETL